MTELPEGFDYVDVDTVYKGLWLRGEKWDGLLVAELPPDGPWHHPFTPIPLDYQQVGRVGTNTKIAAHRRDDDA